MLGKVRERVREVQLRRTTRRLARCVVEMRTAMDEFFAPRPKDYRICCAWGCMRPTELIARHPDGEWRTSPYCRGCFDEMIQTSWGLQEPRGSRGEDDDGWSQAANPRLWTVSDYDPENPPGPGVLPDDARYWAGPFPEPHPYTVPAALADCPHCDAPLGLMTNNSLPFTVCDACGAADDPQAYERHYAERHAQAEEYKRRTGYVQRVYVCPLIPHPDAYARRIACEAKRRSEKALEDRWYREQRYS